MAGFWYPYGGPQDALRRIGRFADHAVGAGCGISFSDGRSIGVLRKPHGGSGGAVWLNVLRRHVAAPKAIAAAPGGPLQKLEHWFEQAITAYGEGETRTAEANMAASRAMVGAISENVWQPAHRWLLRHKLISDGLGVAADTVGVVAGVAFVVTVGPELGLVAILAGGAAAFGSLVLFGVDSAVFGFEVTGDEARAKGIEDNEFVQWARIVGTIMILPDMAVGGVRAIKEVAALAEEGRAAAVAARASDQASGAARARAAKISHPLKHPAAVQKHLHKAKRLARAATEQAATAREAQGRMRLVAARDVNAAYFATPVGASLVLGSPPAVALSQRQKKDDARYLQMIAPEGGMPRDVRLDMRVSVLSKAGRE